MRYSHGSWWCRIHIYSIWRGDVSASHPFSLVSVVGHCHLHKTNWNHMRRPFLSHRLRREEVIDNCLGVLVTQDGLSCVCACVLTETRRYVCAFSFRFLGGVGSLWVLSALSSLRVCCALRSLSFSLSFGAGGVFVVFC